MVLMTPQLEKIVSKGARTTGNPVYPQGGSSLNLLLFCASLSSADLLISIFRGTNNGVYRSMPKGSMHRGKSVNILGGNRSDLQ